MNKLRESRIYRDRTGLFDTKSKTEFTNLDQAIAIGHELIEQRRFDELLDFAAKALPYAPNHPGILNLSVLANWHAGDKKLALKHQEKMLEVEPTNDYLNKRQIQFAFDIGDPAKISQACRSANQHCVMDKGSLNVWGLAENNLGNHKKSLAIFQRLTTEFPKFLQGFYNMSIPLTELGCGQEAVAAFSKVLSPWDGHITNGDTDQVIQKYNDLASSYDANSLHQTWGPQMLAFSSNYLVLSPGDRFLDLGCGTGSVGKALREFGKHHIIGIDLSSNMLEIAKRTNAYEDLIHGNLEECLKKQTGQFNAIFASCALYHIPDLEPVARECGRLLVPGGYFFFSTDPATDDFTIAKTRENEYAHSRRYLKSIADRCSFTTVDIQIATHRRYPGFWCAFRLLVRK